ncbi:MAG: sigma 54-interacting transcriptional regulator [Novosphingobium sp.]|nr:sigma 54-interacting transcriptional regulator [Novosphingobium sp.]
MERDTQFIGQSGAFLDAVERTSRAAPLRRPVLVIGERGTGKELIAERLHQLSKRWAEPLITLNCAALPETLIEAELFGHEGASKPVRVDVRIVAATNEDLPRLAEEGKFRSDLLDRLSFEVITLPPLRVREGDIRVLAEYFGRRMASELRWEDWPGFSDAAMQQLEDYQWPGNVRELRNVIERAVYRWDDWGTPVSHIVFDPFDSPWKPSPMMTAGSGRATGAPSSAPAAPAPSVQLDAISDLKAAVDAHEKAIVEQALARHRYNQRQTAKALGLSYDQLRHCMKKHGLMERGG